MGNVCNMSSIIQNKLVLHVLLSYILKSYIFFIKHAYIKKKKIGPLLTKVPNIMRLTKACSLRCSSHISGWNQNQSNGIP